MEELLHIPRHAAGLKKISFPVQMVIKPSCCTASLVMWQMQRYLVLYIPYFGLSSTSGRDSKKQHSVKRTAARTKYTEKAPASLPIPVQWKASDVLHDRGGIFTADRRKQSVRKVFTFINERGFCNAGFSAATPKRKILLQKRVPCQNVMQLRLFKGKNIQVLELSLTENRRKRHRDTLEFSKILSDSNSHSFCSKLGLS